LSWKLWTIYTIINMLLEVVPFNAIGIATKRFELSKLVQAQRAYMALHSDNRLKIMRESLFTLSCLSEWLLSTGKMENYRCSLKRNYTKPCRTNFCTTIPTGRVQ
jgi:hypothetical protein